MLLVHKQNAMNNFYRDDRMKAVTTLKDFPFAAWLYYRSSRWPRATMTLPDPPTYHVA